MQPIVAAVNQGMANVVDGLPGARRVHLSLHLIRGRNRDPLGRLHVLGDRHPTGHGDAEKGAAWQRIVQLTEKAKSLRQRLQEQKGRSQPARPLTREQVKEYLAAIETLVAETGDRGRALVRSLVEHHGLSARMLDGQNIKIAMALLPPGTGGKPVEIETVATISSDDKIDLWVREENAKGRLCSCGCGRRIEVKRRHYWMGIPKLHGDCRHKAMQAKRASLAGDKYINGRELAERLGISRSTLGRWVGSGKLPKPKRSLSGMLLFECHAIPDAADGQHCNC